MNAETIHFECPHCKQRLRVAASAAGGRARCPKCTSSVIVPPGSALEGESLSRAGSRVLWPWFAAAGLLILPIVGLGIWLIPDTKKQAKPPIPTPVTRAPTNSPTSVVPVPKEVLDTIPTQTDTPRSADTPKSQRRAVQPDTAPTGLASTKPNPESEQPKNAETAKLAPTAVQDDRAIVAGLVLRG